MDTNFEKYGFTLTLEHDVEIADLETFQDSVWYEGHVLTLHDTRTSYEVSVRATGEVKIIDHRKTYDNNVYRSGQSLFKDGDVKSDKHLSQLISKQLLEFDGNNWFECIGQETEGFDGFFECVNGTPKEALNCAVGHLLDIRKELTSFDDTELWGE